MRFAAREKRENEVWLQSWGWQKAKPAGQFQVGEQTMWNTGAKNEIVAIREVSAHYLEFTLEWNDTHGNPQQGPRRLKKDRLVAYP